MNAYNSSLTLLPKVRSAALIEATHHMNCEMRVASFLGRPCSGSVMAVHIDGTYGKGIGTKTSDLCIAAGCDACHKIWDWRDKVGAEICRKQYPIAFMEQILRALVVTQARFVALGLVTVQDQTLV